MFEVVCTDVRGPLHSAVVVAAGADEMRRIVVSRSATGLSAMVILP